MIRIAGDPVNDWGYLNEGIEQVTNEIEGLAGADASCGQLMTVPGIGPIIASATVAAMAIALPLPKGATLPHGLA
jgi:transposase